MKQNEIALLILIVAVSVLGAYFIGNAIVGSPGGDGTQVESVDPISAEVVEPDSRIFNRDAINPTVPVKIGDPANQSPFTGE
jgi:hypothetical protein